MIKVPVLSEVEDQRLRKIFQDLFFNINNEQVIKAGFIFFTFATDKPETLLKVAHGLSFIPLDVIQTSLSGLGAVTYHYDLFDKENIVVSTTAKVTARMLLGRF